MTNNKPRTLTVPDAGCPNVSLEMFAEHTGHIAVTAEDSYGEIDVLFGHEGARRLRDWLTGYLGDEDDTDDDGWEAVTDWKNDPPRPGDEVAWTWTDYGLTITRRGAIDGFDNDGDPLTGGCWLGSPNLGTWRVKRAPTPDPADVLTPGTILRDATTFDGTTSDIAQVDHESEHAGGVWSDGHYGQDICNLTAFTIESTGDRWETKHGRWTITSAEGIRTELNGGNA